MSYLRDDYDSKYIDNTCDEYFNYEFPIKRNIKLYFIRCMINSV